MSRNVTPRETTKKELQRDAFKTQRSQKAILNKKCSSDSQEGRKKKTGKRKTQNMENKK